MQNLAPWCFEIKMHWPQIRPHIECGATLVFSRELARTPLIVRPHIEWVLLSSASLIDRCLGLGLVSRGVVRVVHLGLVR